MKGTQIMTRLMRNMYEEALQMSSMPKAEAFCVKKGRGRVFISAPHSFEHIRNGEQKPAEPGTAALALLLSKGLGCPVAYRTSPEGGDPNWDDRSQYRDEVHKMVAALGCVLLVDLHQLSPSRNVDVDLGTAGGENLLGNTWISDFMVEKFEAAGYLNVLIDKPFAARKPQTVAASTALRCQIPAVQIEINSRYLIPGYAEYKPERVYETLSSITREIEGRLTR